VVLVEAKVIVALPEDLEEVTSRQESKEETARLM
jgi:hypothetical protein